MYAVLEFFVGLRIFQNPVFYFFTSLLRWIVILTSSLLASHTQTVLWWIVIKLADGLTVQKIPSYLVKSWKHVLAGVIHKEGSTHYFTVELRPTVSITYNTWENNPDLLVRGFEYVCTNWHMASGKKWMWQMWQRDKVSSNSMTLWTVCLHSEKNFGWNCNHPFANETVPSCLSLLLVILHLIISCSLILYVTFWTYHRFQILSFWLVENNLENESSSQAFCMSNVTIIRLRSKPYQKSPVQTPHWLEMSSL